MNLFDRIGFAYIGRVGSVAVTVSISLERYLNCCHSTQDFSFKSLLVPFPICFAFIYNIPKFFEMRTCTKTEKIMLKNVSAMMTTSTGERSDILEMTTERMQVESSSDILVEKSFDTSANLLFSDFETSLASAETLISTRTTNSTINLSDLSTFLFSSTESTYEIANSSHLSLTTSVNDDLETETLVGADLDSCEGGYQTTELRNSSWYIIYYVFWSKFLLVEIIPWISVIVLTILTSRKIKQFQENRHRLLGNSSRQNITRGCNDEGKSHFYLKIPVNTLRNMILS